MSPLRPAKLTPMLYRHAHTTLTLLQRDCYTLSLLLLLFFSTHAYCDQASQLATDANSILFPFVSTTSSQFSSFYAGDSHSFPNNGVLTNLLDIGEVLVKEYIPSLDGTEGRLSTEAYAMKFVAYDLRLQKLKTVDSIGLSFSVQMQIFLEWEEWITNQTLELVQRNDCTYVCDTSRPVSSSCCDQIWVPRLSFPNADVNRMDSTLSKGKEGIYYDITQDPCTISQTNTTFGEANCFQLRFWEISLDATFPANMSFRNFPFDVQQLYIDIRNPHSSRTWLQLNQDSLEQNAGNLIPKIIRGDMLTMGWKIADVIVSPLCDVLNWKETFLGLNNYLFDDSTKSQAKDIEQYMADLKCPKLPSVAPNIPITEYLTASGGLSRRYESINESYSERLDTTLAAYTECVKTKGISYTGNLTLPGWIGVPDPNSPLGTNVSLLCLIDAVLNLTTPGIRVSIIVKRYTEFYVIKLVIPMIVCVGFAFTAFALPVKDVGNRLMVVVPAAIALTALQVTVVATDIPVISYIVPTTWLMLWSYIIQLLIAIESIIVYKLRYWKQGPSIAGHDISGSSAHNIAGHDTSRIFTLMQEQEHEECTPRGLKPRNWSARFIDLLLMSILIILYVIAILLCTLLPSTRLSKPECELLSNGISILNETTMIYT